MRTLACRSGCERQTDVAYGPPQWLREAQRVCNKRWNRDLLVLLYGQVCHRRQAPALVSRSSCEGFGRGGCQADPAN